MRLQEREAHAAADEHLVGHAEERVDDLELVAHLGAAEHRDERPGGVLAEAEQHLDLGGEEAAGGAGQVLRGPDDGRVGAVRRAEGVVHVGVEAVDEPRDEGRVVALLPRVEPQVLEQLHAGGELGEPSADRGHGVAVVRRALRPAEVGRRDDGRALLLQPLDGGQRGADAEVVGDGPVLHRDVEVGAQQDAAGPRAAGGPPGWGRRRRPRAGEARPSP